jgi:alpha-glucosidase
MNGSRPLIITRAGFAGLQRYTSIWTGDNQATDHHMMLGVRLVNSLGLSGISFTGSDVGGFGGNATPELFARWIQIGAFTPFYRGHSAHNTASAEPWVFGEQTERISRNYIQLRYNLLPYVYNAMHESTINGMPLNRSLAIDYTSDEKVFWRIYQNQFMFGPSLLIIPVESTKEITKAYLPQGDWYDFYTDQFYSGQQEIIAECPIDKLPVYVKSGCMVAMQSPIQSTKEMPSDTLQIHLYENNGDADLVWDYYEDDGVTYDFEEGKYFARQMVYKPSIKEVVFKAVEGDYNSKFKNIQLVFHGFDDLGNIVKFDGKPRKIELLTMDFQHAAEKPIEGQPSGISCPTIIFPNQNGEMVVTW